MAPAGLKKRVPNFCVNFLKPSLFPRREQVFSLRELWRGGVLFFSACSAVSKGLYGPPSKCRREPLFPFPRLNFSKSCTFGKVRVFEICVLAEARVSISQFVQKCAGQISWAGPSAPYVFSALAYILERVFVLGFKNVIEN